jgi:hypothetical protein
MKMRDKKNVATEKGYIRETLWNQGGKQTDNGTETLASNCYWCSPKTLNLWNHIGLTAPSPKSTSS